MNLFLSTHGKTFRAEWQKLKRTGIFWLCLGSALFIPVINTLVGFLMDADPTAENVWGRFLQNNFIGFTGFFFPLFLVIAMVRLVYLEHRSDTWKLMETQPVARLSLYIVKYEVALLISFLCLLGLLGFALLGGTILGAAKPATGFGKSAVPWGEVLAVLVRYWIASWAQLAIQYFLSILIKSFAWPMTIGLVAIIAGGMFAGFKVLGWFPYSALAYTSAAYKGGNTGGFLLYHEMLSLAWAALFLWLGYQLFIKRGFAAAFIRGGKRLVPTLGVLAAFTILFWIITKPSVSNPYSKTVLAGTLAMDKLPGEVQLLQAPAFNVVMSGKVADGRFHLSTGDQLPKGMYYLRAGSVRMPVFFGANDSLHVALTTGKSGTELKFGGTRMAENEFLKEYEPGTGYLQTYGHTLTPTEYSSRVMDRLESEGKEIDRYKTVDNVKPADDFIALQKKTLAVELLQLLDVEYPRSFAVYYPNDTLKWGKSVERLRKQVSLSDTDLATNEKYIGYLYDYWHSKTANASNRDSAFFAAAQSIPAPALRNAVMYKELESRIATTRDSVRRNGWLQQWLPAVSDIVFQKQLQEQANRMNSLQKGRPAPAFAALGMNDKNFDMANLSRRYVVIDVWATWCGPCKREKPHFDQLAERFTSENVAFVSLSIDEDKDAWRRSLYDASKRVLQLWAVNAAEDFVKSYAVASIPRFILIDPKGRIVNAQLPPPSDPEFEATLKREIPYLERY